MASDHLDAIKNQLQLEKNDDFRQSAFVAFLEDKERGANMIVGFAADIGIKADAKEVIEYLESIDDDEVDVEVTADMLASVSGGVGKCSHGN